MKEKKKKQFHCNLNVYHEDEGHERLLLFLNLDFPQQQQ